MAMYGHARPAFQGTLHYSLDMSDDRTHACACVRTDGAASDVVTVSADSNYHYIQWVDIRIWVMNMIIIRAFLAFSSDSLLQHYEHFISVNML